MAGLVEFLALSPAASYITGQVSSLLLNDDLVVAFRLCLCYLAHYGLKSLVCRHSPSMEVLQSRPLCRTI